MMKDIKVIAFDADDTLWDCQSHFEEVEKEYASLLEPWGTPEEVSAALFSTESGNMPLLGYGCKAFTISLVENAISFSHGEIKAGFIDRIVQLGKSLLELKATPLPGVKETIQQLAESKLYKLVVFTKGELLDQQNKLNRSGLAGYFDDVVIVSDKTTEEYTKLCKMNGIKINELLMVGNSFRSDIEPVLKLGGYAVHIPFKVEWKHEAMESYSHEHLATIKNISELLEIEEKIKPNIFSISSQLFTIPWEIGLFIFNTPLIDAASVPT